jgi:hypothetical protein
MAISTIDATSTGSTGTVMVSGNMPAFSAYLASSQTVTSTVTTKVAYDTEVFDTNSNFASNRFTPTVAGYYQVNVTVCGQSTASMTVLLGYIYKNGSSYRAGINLTVTGNARAAISDLIYMNGSTDYLEVYARVDGTGTVSFAGGADASSFSACLVRAA